MKLLRYLSIQEYNQLSHQSGLGVFVQNIAKGICFKTNATKDNRKKFKKRHQYVWKMEVLYCHSSQEIYTFPGIFNKMETLSTTTRK